MSFSCTLKKACLRNTGLIIAWIGILICVGVSKVNSQGTVNGFHFMSATGTPNIHGSVKSQIYLELPESTLCNALTQVEQRSAIHFKCPEHLWDQVLPPTILQGTDWVSAVQELLENYNTLAFYNSAGDLTQVYLLGSRENYPSTSTTISSKRTNEQIHQTSVTSDQPGSNLNRSQLFALLKTSTFKPFPQHFFKNPVYQEILNFADIKTPKDWLLVEKSRTLKTHIQKLLKK